MHIKAKRDPIWMIEVHDNPSDPDWAAWCAITDMFDLELDELDKLRMSRGEVLRISGLVV